ncbi:hypothetical protein [Martelella alba]|uniref:Phage Mu protein F like protein n=1 Tax=Martelella alba TaxID=2590451 RepID=A0ABY2SDS0_9HYPH|nr:hypothetical protein [Martelella alba]TKI02731.1 hypothetical protein FCN80_24115 [Martelella alba]
MTFYEIITQAIAEFSRRGYRSDAELQAWVAKIRQAANEVLVPERVLNETLRRSMISVYRKQIENRSILKNHRGIDRFTLQRVQPTLRAELDRRIMASADLIKLNRQAAVNRTIQRFSGWATSIPEGGSLAINKNDVKEDLRKSLAQLPFVERRVAIDQGHKFVSSLNGILATNGGALAAIWHSHYHQPGYDYRIPHKKRDSLVYTIRGNWAIAKGLMKVGPAGYTDKITQPGEEVYCRCYYTYLYNLRDLPDDMLTAKGRAAIGR